VSVLELGPSPQPFLASYTNNSVVATTKQIIERRLAGGNVWLSQSSSNIPSSNPLSSHRLNYEILESEDAVGRAQFDEIIAAANGKAGSLVIVLLGGRGAQALHKLLGQLAQTDHYDELLARLHVCTQDALAPMRLDNGLSFVRDFERLLGQQFFKKIKSFICMRTDAEDLEAEMESYIEKLEALGGIDIFFLGMGPEPEAASHLAYIKPGSGAAQSDVAGLIPISSSILQHHISKFKVGGSTITEQDEQECRAATHILTLGPAAILGAKRIVQSIVDASTAPGKKASYRRLLDTEISNDPGVRADQLNENPGLWVRLHPNVRSLVLSDVIENSV
jgi:6-phosphogluconolactonase/glucosamine-6-phosphate isomerase/deaminase